jgi:hypothetical protein
MATSNLCVVDNQPALSGLAYGAITAPWGKWLKMEVTIAYGNAAEQVYKRVNYNANAWKNSLPGFEDYSIDAVDAILSAYAVGVHEKQIPVYKDDGDTNDKKTVYDYITQKTGYTNDLVRAVMYEAYWSVYGKNPVNPPAFILQPYEFMTKSDSIFDALRKETSDTLNIVKWLAIIGIGAYALSQLNIASRTFRK